ncbi:hypothetical protein SAMN05444483_1273 [Salegentibacter echinorum]|uniref:GLPGLI family protein n=1 Tax=Salegentibacter echinorum TaxID=1073325 RepID=A0A1M5MCI6_SALEC|nr:hypothetical protein [Salegentibacter echinorum]SHG74935.1 hypothetical protein SAMN05444483_1273 [Salegentibacter echinorum]
MAAIKVLSLLLILCPILSFGQKSVYPKDTIYVMFKKNEANRKITNWDYKKKNGVYFSIKDKSSKHLSLFYPYTKKADTLCIEKLKEYCFSDLKEIEEKKNNWINKKFEGLKYKPYTSSKNGVFRTYLIEIISEGEFVKYPVIWRNEGVID